ncbi:MAG: PilZ domain-containing protein [Deltaproteobacteria bacterium]|nr:PilZ domain-containing protein [Deltaproteobacteria bacterium]
MTRTLHAVVTKAQFQESYLKDLPDGGLFLQTDESYSHGDAIILKLQIAGLREEMEFCGTVAWHRRPRTWSSSLPAGIGFQFDARDAARRDFLLRFVAGEVGDRRLSGPRHKSEYDARIKIDDTWVAAKIINLGAGGMTLISEEKLDTGATLPCVVYLEDESGPADCNVQVERVEYNQSTFVAGVRFLRLPKGLREAFDDMPVSLLHAAESQTRAQQILRRSTFPPPRPVTGTFAVPSSKK